MLTIKLVACQPAIRASQCVVLSHLPALHILDQSHAQSFISHRSKSYTRNIHQLKYFPISIKVSILVRSYFTFILSPGLACSGLIVNENYDISQNELVITLGIPSLLFGAPFLNLFGLFSIKSIEKKSHKIRGKREPSYLGFAC